MHGALYGALLGVACLGPATQKGRHATGRKNIKERALKANKVFSINDATFKATVLRQSCSMLL